ncbi:GNAT family N-acetyltransferase [Glycomyces tritici]|uniref:GNAT family N-acetyltransferase n=1 Tax=Glycomyces tritici TaxID=2665176 RepID=A0ABT7YWL7_9ACTN|nr:GNAT family N-acetyltransferase [Glycomyces tritici]MDN3243022.1 GNAT family N-acetyltransferase [Glycomyces tritici]
MRCNNNRATTLECRMRIAALVANLTEPVRDLMTTGAPWVRPRDPSDYWLAAELFADTCPVAIADDGTVTGAAIGFRSQTRPADVYVQDVIVHPAHRRQGIAAALISHLRTVASAAGATRIYLTSEPANTAAHAAWLALGFTNRHGDYRDPQTGVEVIANSKGPGKDRAVYDLDIA